MTNVSLAEARAHFDLPPNTTYLDSATYGLPPRETAQAMHQAIYDWQAGSADWVRDWDRTGESCRADFAALIGTSADTIALLPTVSTGVGTVAASLGPNDEVLVPDDEYASVLNPLLVVQRERGVHIKLVPLSELANQVSPRTTLVACSLIQMQSGRAAPLPDVVEAARAVGARTLVDATHAVPFVPLADDIDRIDYLLCAAYKHLLCPRGVAFMHVARERWDVVPPILANWRSRSDVYGGYFGSGLELAPNAARFDVSLAWFSWVGGSVSLRLLADWHRQGLLPEAVNLARQLAQRLGLEPPLGTVVGVPVADAESVRLRLAEAGIKAAVRGTNVRLSTHVYTTLADVDRAAEALKPSVRAPAAT
ncbi:MAG TPA: aminotransferase class V-fold PLP-dependent enzyme [Chloroflexota bacterium]